MDYAVDRAINERLERDMEKKNVVHSLQIQLEEDGWDRTIG